MSRRAKRTADKIMEYPDAPSGFVKLYNYKEPFMRFERGHGYQGVLLMDGSGKTVQCHLCGEWFGSLISHVRLHDMNTDQYKVRVGLDLTTALISETVRAKWVHNRAPKQIPWAKLSRVERKKRIDAWRKSFRAGQKRVSVEKQNSKGTCPEQLIKWLQDLTKKLGRTPTHKELASRRGTIDRVFGSMEEAMRRARIQRRTINDPRPSFATREHLIQQGQDFHRAHKRIPRYSDHRRRFISPPYHVFVHRFGSYKKFQRVLKQSL